LHLPEAGELHRYRHNEVTDAKKKFRFMGKSKMLDDAGSGG
jgi:hypothetical protein